MDHTPFLNAIAADETDDVAPYLVYADWLEDHGDLRAEFIRLQCAESLSVAEQLQMRWLQAAHQGEWLRPLRQSLGALDLGIRKYSFHRGLPAGVQIGSQNWYSWGETLVEACPLLRDLTIESEAYGQRLLPEAEALRYVRSLTLPENPVSRELEAVLTSAHVRWLTRLDVQPGVNATSLLTLLSSLPWIGRLRTLRVQADLVPDASHVLAEPAFAGLRDLDLGRRMQRNPGTAARSLAPWAWQLESLRANGATVVPLLKLLPQLNSEPRLKSLNLNGTMNSLRTREWKELPGCPHLVSLSLDECELSPADVQNLAETPWLGSLRRLSLRDNVFEDRGLAALASSPMAGTLELLDVNHSGVGDPGLAVLAKSDLKNLTALNIGACPHSASGLQELLASPAVQTLRSLTVGNLWNLHTSETAAILARAMPTLPLERLHLSAFNEGAACLKRLAAAECPRLRELVFVSSGIDDEALKALLDAPWASRLVILDLSQNALTERSVEALAASPQMRSLRELSLARNRIGPGGLQALAESPHLQRLVHLDVSSNRPSGSDLMPFLRPDGFPDLLSLGMSGIPTASASRGPLQQRFGAKVDLDPVSEGWRRYRPVRGGGGHADGAH